MSKETALAPTPTTFFGRAAHYSRAWYWASRPFTLTASVAPVLVGSALAFREGQFDGTLFFLVLLGSLLVQVTANLVDEYSDHSRPEGKEKLVAPYKVIARGVISSSAVKKGAVVAFGMATVVGLYLVSVAGWPLLVACLASAVAAYLYSGGPRPLGAIGLGQPLVFLFMGPVMVMGSYYVYTRDITFDALWLSMPVACTVTTILAANDLRDLEEDRAGGKVTPVTLWGRAFGRWECTGLPAVAYLYAEALAFSGFGVLTFVAPLLALPLAARMVKAVWRSQDRPALAGVLRQSARFHGWFGLLLALGVALGKYVQWP